MSDWIKWAELPWEEVNQNISRKVVMKNRMMTHKYAPLQQM